MTLTVDSLKTWCQALLSGDSGASLSLGEYLSAVPQLGSLSDVPQGTPVLVRGDVDAKPGPKLGDGDIRLRSMKETLQFGIDRGWKQIVFGHIGRKPEGSLDKVAARLGEILGCDVPLVDDWMDDATGTISAALHQQIVSAPHGSVLMLQNTRKYDLERVLWKAKPSDLDGMGEPLQLLANLANEMADKVANVYVHEAFSAGSLDTSSVIVPAAMKKVALGKYIADEFTGPMMKCLDARLVVFSGLKTDKLDDLEAMIDRGKIRLVIGGGSLAMALKKAAVELDGGEFSLGASQDPVNKDQPFYIAPHRVKQAKRMISSGREKGIEFVLPVDFVLGDERSVEELSPQDQQFDVGPKTSAHYAQRIDQFIKNNPTGDPNRPVVAFHNGVFGMFEDERFAHGTKRFMQELKKLHDAGVLVYVGGGEGGAAVEQYLGEENITHLFTAGGTVLNALGSEPVPYLVALRLAAK